MIAKFVLNSILHHVGMLRIICSNEEMLHDNDERNYPDWLNKGVNDVIADKNVVTNIMNNSTGLQRIELNDFA